MKNYTEKTLPANAEYSPDYVLEDDEEQEENPFRRFQFIEDARNEIKGHLTSEELLMFAVYKNSRRQNNNVYRMYIKAHGGRNLSCSAITHRKKRLLSVLGHVTAMLTFKRTKNIDRKLQDLLTTRQFNLLQKYEKRVPLKEIGKDLGYSDKWNNISKRFKLTIEKLYDCRDPDIQRYVTLLGNVLRFSRKFPISKR